MVRSVYLPPDKNAKPKPRIPVQFTEKPPFGPDEVITCKQFVGSLQGPDIIYRFLVENRLRGVHARYADFVAQFEALKTEPVS